MDIHFIWEALGVLFIGFCLLRIVGKKTVAEMTGLEVITLLAIASMIGHAVAGKGFWKTVMTLCTFVILLMVIQYLAIKADWAERWFMGKATLVIQNGEIVKPNLKKLRLSVDQLEAKLREKGISSLRDVKTATIEMSGHLGYEWANHAKPVTVGEIEKIFSTLYESPPPKKPKKEDNLFQEVVYDAHQKPIPPELD